MEQYIPDHQGNSESYGPNAIFVEDASALLLNEWWSHDLSSLQADPSDLRSVADQELSSVPPSDDYDLTNVDTSIRASFCYLRDKWLAETQFTSSGSNIISNSSYRAIIDLGPQVVPLIFDELRKETNHWFFALSELTGYTPTLTGRTNMERMRLAWLGWADANGYLQDYAERGTDG